MCQLDGHYSVCCITLSMINEPDVYHSSYDNNNIRDNINVHPKKYTEEEKIE